MIAGISTSFIASPFELTKLGSQIELVIRRRALELEVVRVSGQTHVSPTAAASKVFPNGMKPEELVKPSGTFSIARKLIKTMGGSAYTQATDICLFEMLLAPVFILEFMTLFGQLFR